MKSHEPLNANLIRQTLPPPLRTVTIEILEQVASTNQYIIDKKHIDSGYVCLAESQTAGRGRRGKTWVSPYAQNIYLSLLWHFPKQFEGLSSISLVAGVAVANALRAYGIHDLGLKWPNDVIYLHRKLAGILVEVAGEIDNCYRVVIGIGINVMMSDPDAEQINQPWIDVQTILCKSPSRNAIVGLVIHEIFSIMHHFQQEGFSAIADSWNQLDILQGKTVVVTGSTNEVIGTALGVDSLGRLLVQDGKIRHCFSSGEVSVRGKT